MLGIGSTSVITRALPYCPGLTLTLMKFTARTYTSTTTVSFAPYNTLKVVLDQINTETNRYNGGPSTVLDVIGVETSSFGETPSETSFMF